MMGRIKVEKFGGMLPAWDARFLPDSQSAFAQNTYLYSGAAQGWRKPKLLRALTNSAAKYAFRVPTITQGVAGGNLTVTAPVEGDTVTLGEITYKLTATPKNPFDVLLAGTALQTAEALFLGINFGSYDTALVGANTPANPAAASGCPYVGNPFSFFNSTNTPGANTIVLVRVVPSGTMKITDVNLMPAATQGAAKFTGVVYENVNQINAAGTSYVDIPTTIAAIGSEVVGCVAGVPVVSHLPVAITLQGGSTYWVGFIMDTAVPLQLASTGLSAVSNANPYTSGPPNPFQITNISGVTTGGTSVGSLQTKYNLNQPNWQVWGSMVTIGPLDPLNTLAANVLHLQAPEFGSAYNQTPIAESTAGARLSWAGATFFSGGKNQSSDTTITGASQWLEFLDQDTNVLRTPVVDDVFQRYYFASPSLPPQYNTYDRIAAALPPFYLGVPAPPIAPTLSVAAGGNPTQLGFPGSSTSNTFNMSANPLLVLYPVRSTVQVALSDISLNVGGVVSGASLTFTGAVFADNNGVAGDLIAFGASSGSITASGVAKSTFDAPPTLLAHTQYWIGVSMTGMIGVLLSESDTGSQGFSAPVPSPYPTDPITGGIQAPTMAANFPNLQLWADIDPTSATAQEETRAYVYTWVTAYGEEGPPSPPALLDAFDNATWTVGMQPPLAQDMGTLRNIVKTNIYRTMASVQGGTSFFYVGTVAAGTTTFIDQVTDDLVAQNLILPSTNWFGPPTTLQGIVAMPNGMMAGFKANEVWFSEPFRPHAWPAGYVMTTDYPIVGLGVVGTTLVACTDTNPHTFTGVNPKSMSQTRIPLAEPCTSRGGILSTENGVYYSSANGLIRVARGGSADNMTQSWITRERWDQLTPQKFVRCTKNVSTYFAFGTTGVTNGQADTSVAQQGFTIELSEVAEHASFDRWPPVGGHRLGFSTLTSPVGVNVDNILGDPWTGVTMLLAGGSIYYYDFTDQAPVITPYLWRSKKFHERHRDDFSALRVWFDIPPGGPQSPPATRTVVPFSNASPTSARLAFQPGMFGVVRIIADGIYVTERELRSSEELMRVSAAQRYTTWQIEIEGVVSVSTIKMATSVKELALIPGHSSSGGSQ